MTPQEIMLLPVAPVGGDGSPRCITCATAPVMVVDEQQPALCVCPTCGSKAQTPTILAVAILAMRLRAAEARLDRDDERHMGDDR